MGQGSRIRGWRWAAAVASIISTMSLSPGISNAQTSSSAVDIDSLGVRWQVGLNGSVFRAGTGGRTGRIYVRWNMNDCILTASGTIEECTYQGGPWSGSALLNGVQPSPDAIPYLVIEGGVVVGMIWAIPPTSATPGQLGVINQAIAGLVPAPNGTIGASPEVRGLTGLETWFWISGTESFVDGVSATEVNALGKNIHIELSVRSADWDFGDGTESEGDFGQPAPQRSSVRHLYEHDSDSVPFGVRAVFAIAARYRIGNGIWFSLPAINRTATLGYPVIESRSQLIPNP